jgi:hypothetical protein
MKSIKIWRKRKAYGKNSCIFCGELIPSGEEYIRPTFPSSLDVPISPGHKTTWQERRPYFHKDCFCYLRNGFAPRVGILEYKDYDWVQVADKIINSWCHL